MTQATRIARSPSPFRRFLSKNLVGYLFLLPFLLLFILFTVLPVCFAIGFSFTNFDMLQAFDFIGLRNYQLLFLEDNTFMIAMRNTVTFACIAGPVGFFLSFLMAWVINQLKFKSFFSLAFYVPSLANAVAMSVVWLYFFSSDRYGLINNFLLRVGVIMKPILWVSDDKYILGVVIFVSIWMSMGTGFLTFLAGLQNLSPELFEAAMVDGIRNKVQELFYIVLPQLKPQILFGAINSVVGAFAVFDVALYIAGFPSPNYAAYTLISSLYDHAFVMYEMGYACAIAVVLFSITFILGQLFMKVFRSKSDV